MQLHEVFKDQFDVIEDIRPLRVLGEFDFLPGGQFGKDLFSELFEPSLETLQFARGTVVRYQLRQFFNLLLELIDFFSFGNDLIGH